MPSKRTESRAMREAYETAQTRWFMRQRRHHLCFFGVHLSGGVALLILAGVLVTKALLSFLAAAYHLDEAGRAQT